MKTEVQEAYEAVVHALRQRCEWERARALGEVTVTTAPNPMREVRFLMAAMRREAQRENLRRD